MPGRRHHPGATQEATLATFAGPFRVIGLSTVFVRTGEAGTRSHLHFCPTCGSTVFHTEAGQGERWVCMAVGTAVLNMLRRLARVNLPDPNVRARVQP